MSETRYFKVAGHRFGVTAGADDFALMTNYEPFADSETCDTAIELTIGKGLPVSYNEELRQEEEGKVIVCGRTTDEQAVFEYQWFGEEAGWLVCSDDYREGRLITTGHHTKLAIDNALMVLFALATSAEGTVLFHAAVVSHEGHGYMFLGPSGTGKSTHASLWVRHIENTELVNDDNPVVRVFDDGTARVYGSPWSGKTPCYRNVSYPLDGIVLLSQAPHNKICRLGGLHAYASLVASISGMRWDARVAEGLHQTENALVSMVPVWHLDCLPDEDAARICQKNIKR